MIRGHNSDVICCPGKDRNLTEKQGHDNEVMKTIVVTGVAGFLGSHIATALVSRGHRVIGNDNMIGGFTANIPAGVEYHNTDCCDFQGMVKICQGADVVIHTAATAHEGLSVFSPSFITKNIFDATVTTTSAAIAADVKRFVMCSSMARYGDQTAPFTEDMDTKPVDPYGIAKAAAEQVLKTLCEVHDMEFNVAVPHNIIGPGQNYTDPYRNVLSIMLNRSLSGKPIYIYGTGQQVRCFSYIDDCVESLIRIALDKNIVNNTINIGPDRGSVTIEQLANMVVAETGSTEPHIYTQGRPQEVSHATCSSDKARELLDFECVTKLEDAITHTADWIRKHGTKEFDYHIPLEIQTHKTPITWKNKLL